MAERLIHLNAFENASPVNISSGTLRETIYGAGQRRLRDDHPGRRFRRS